MNSQALSPISGVVRKDPSMAAQLAEELRDPKKASGTLSLLGFRGFEGS